MMLVMTMMAMKMMIMLPLLMMTMMMQMKGKLWKDSISDCEMHESLRCLMVTDDDCVNVDDHYVDQNIMEGYYKTKLGK